MSVMALITNSRDTKSVISWAAQFAAAQSTSLYIVCWKESPTLDGIVTDSSPSASDFEPMVAEVEHAVEMLLEKRPEYMVNLTEADITIRRIEHPSSVTAALEQAREIGPDLLVASGVHASAGIKGAIPSSQFLRQSPCDTIMLYGNGERSRSGKCIHVATNDSSHDRKALELAAQFAEVIQATVTVLRVESDIGEEALEVGMRELRTLFEDANIENSEHVVGRVVLGEDAIDGAIEVAADQDLVIMGAGMENAVHRLLAGTEPA